MNERDERRDKKNRQAAYNQTYRTLFQTAPLPAVTGEISQAEILSPGRGFMGMFDFTMRFQLECPGGYLFCYVSGQAVHHFCTYDTKIWRKKS